MVVTAEEVHRLALSLPRAYEVVVADRVKFRVGRLVFLTFSRDETLMGFGFPREERAALVAAEPHKFRMPRTSDLRYNWVVASLDHLDPEEMRELVIDAWRMVVPKRVAAEYLGTHRFIARASARSGRPSGGQAEQRMQPPDSRRCEVDLTRTGVRCRVWVVVRERRASLDP